jgi:HlyD family secretion protein
MRHGSRLILILVAALAVAAGLAWIAFRPVAVTAELAEVVAAPMVVTVDVDGKTRIRELYQVATPIAGTSQRSPVRVGDRVVKDQSVVARVQPVSPSLLDARSLGQAEAAVHEAEAAQRLAVSQLSQAEEALAYAETEYDRAKAMLDRGVATASRVEAAAQAVIAKRAARDAASSQLAVAKSSLERARAALIGPGEDGSEAASCCIDIRAPADGVVLDIVEVSERPVAAGAPLLSIGAPDDLEIVAEPLSRDAVRIPAAAKAEVLRWGGDQALSATLVRLDPSAHTEVSALGIEEQRVEAVFAFDGAAAQGIGNGYAVWLRIAVWRGDAVVQVPLSALFRQGEDWAVYAVEGGVAHLVRVEIGHQNDSVAEVLSGLAPGAMVVTHPSDAVAEGTGIVATTRE